MTKCVTRIQLPNAFFFSDEDMNSPAVKAFRETFEAVPLDQIRQQLERVRLEKGEVFPMINLDL